MRRLGLRRRRASSQDSAEAYTQATIRLGVLFLTILVFMISNFVLYSQSSMPGLGWRYVCLPPIVLVILLAVGSRYEQLGYQIESFWAALNDLMANLGLGSYPTLVVSDGKAQIKADEDNLVARIGGPGFVVVQPGNAALVESLDGRLRVLGPGRHFLNRLQTLKEFVGLEEREASIDKLSATTKDGIEVQVRDIRYRYRLASEKSPQDGPARSMQDPYPFSEDAVIQMTYNRTVTVDGLASWHFGVNRIVDTVITDYIRENYVDHLTAPSAQGDDPRGEIYRKFNSEHVQHQFKCNGADLLWIGIGHFEIPAKQVVEQRVTSWQAKWIGNANVVRAFGESQRMAYQELGRAEAEAEMLMSIVHALEDVGAQQGDSRQKIRAIYLARIAQLLEAMGKQYLPSQENTPPRQ
jgi:hypothetical protein